MYIYILHNTDTKSNVYLYPILPDLDINKFHSLRKLAVRLTTDDEKGGSKRINQWLIQYRSCARITLIDIVHSFAKPVWIRLTDCRRSTLNYEQQIFSRSNSIYGELNGLTLRCARRRLSFADAKVRTPLWGIVVKRDRKSKQFFTMSEITL